MVSHDCFVFLLQLIMNLCFSAMSLSKSVQFIVPTQLLEVAFGTFSILHCKKSSLFRDFSLNDVSTACVLPLDGLGTQGFTVVPIILSYRKFTMKKCMEWKKHCSVICTSPWVHYEAIGDYDKLNYSF